MAEICKDLKCRTIGKHFIQQHPFIDPLVRVEAVVWRCRCGELFANDAPPTTKKPEECWACGGGAFMDLLSRSVVRKAMVEWLRGEVRKDTPFPVGDTAEAINELADRLEREEG